MPRKKKRLKVGLALGTGAARGLSQIGVIKALDRAGVRIHCIAGTSVGAMIGCGYSVLGNIRKVESIALKTDWKKLFSLVDLRFPTRGLLDGRRVEDFIRYSIGRADFSEARIPLAVVATDVSTAERVVIRHGDIAKAVRASISIPVMFRPFNHENRCLIDGGLVDPVPVRLAREMGADYVIAVNTFYDLKRFFSWNGDEALGQGGEILSCEFEEEKVDENIFGRLNRVIRTPTIIKATIRAISIMERHLAIPQLHEADAVITPDVKHIGSTEYTRAADCIERGERAVEEALPSILQRISK